MTTRKGLVAKKRSFSPQSDDEKESRRQKKGVFRLKMTTRKHFIDLWCETQVIMNIWKTFTVQIFYIYFS
ncbi:hypothetical protein P9386_11035 [Caldifermentibacillus hisashii]|uniref:hypothetical protein n=1 Tax=Caldifermentibacillus hisashii TaxID=996558 RepID=UPI002E1B6188|nr:hypothetical protein [Caldifermentibacillus hisashii]